MPRHSRGCRNCVRRHIRCDRSQPTCKNCEAQELTCDGPLEGLRFVFMSGHSDPTILTNRTASPSIGQTRRVASVPEIERRPSPTPYDMLGQNPGLDTYFCSLLATATPQEKIWLQCSMRDPETHPVSSLAIEALSTARFAKVSGEQRLLTTAAQKYTNAIVALQCALDDVNRYNFDVLAAVCAMRHYELLIRTTDRGWIQHAGGASKVIEMLGPSLFKRHPYKAILESNRFRIIHEAYYHRKSTFLRKKSWQLARVCTSDTEVQFHKLQDLYGALADVAVQATLVKRIDEENIEQKQAILDTVDNLIQDLDAWMEEWKAVRNFTTRRTEIQPNDTFYSDPEGLLFTESLSYPTIKDSIGVNMCMAIKLSALDWQRKLEQSSWWLGLAKHKLTDIPEARSTAIDICRGLHRYFDAKGVVSNIDSLMYIAISAHKAFRRSSREIRWLQALLMKIVELTGFELPRVWITCYENRSEL